MFVCLCMPCCVGGGIKIQLEGVGFLLPPCSPLSRLLFSWLGQPRRKVHPKCGQCHLRSQALDWVEGSTGMLHELATVITAPLTPPVMDYNLELWAITPSFLRLLLSGYLVEAIGNGTKTGLRKQAYSAMEVCMQLVHRDGGQWQDKNISASVLGVLTVIQRPGGRKRWSYAFKICFKNVPNFMSVNACLHVDMCTCRYADLLESLDLGEKSRGAENQPRVLCKSKEHP